MNPFTFPRLPDLHIGLGSAEHLPALLAGHQRVLLVRGGRSLDSCPAWPALASELARAHELHTLRVRGEPLADDCERWRQEYCRAGIDAVLAIGGGAVLDVGKALAGLLASGTSLWEHLEGFGAGLPFPGHRLPLIMLPTTAGTGSETTQNAVFGGEHAGIAFKKSIRHPALVADHALIDGRFQEGCPPALTAACGMDAFTQLLESHLSSKANPLTQAWALTGLQALVGHLKQAVINGNDLAARQQVAFAAMCSGVCLAQAGLGLVHGFAPWLGAWHGLPHGVACGTVMAAANTLTVAALRARAPAHPARERYAELGRLCAGDPALPIADAEDAALAFLLRLRSELPLPGLATYHIDATAIEHLISADKLLRNHPIVLDATELRQVLTLSL